MLCWAELTKSVHSLHRPISTDHNSSLPPSILRLGEVRLSSHRGGKHVPDKDRPAGELGSQRRPPVLGSSALFVGYLGVGCSYRGGRGLGWGARSLLPRPFHLQPGIVTQHPALGTSPVREGQESRNASAQITGKPLVLLAKSRALPCGKV